MRCGHLGLLHLHYAVLEVESWRREQPALGFGIRVQGCSASSDLVYQAAFFAWATNRRRKTQCEFVPSCSLESIGLSSA